MAAAAVALCPLTVPAAAVAAPGSGGSLSPRLAELAKPAVRSAPPAKQARALGVALGGPGSLLRSGNRVVVDVRFDRGAGAGADALRAAGATVEEVSSRYQTVTAVARPADLPAIAAVAHVESVREVFAPIAAAASPCFGAATSEGDVQLRAAEARNAFGVDGSGVTVGILSDSFDRDAFAPTHAAEDVASGDLPGPGSPCPNQVAVNPVDDSETEGADEGRAMAQIVHDLAPGAALAFATAFKPDLFGFADNVRALAAAGADVIVDDVFYVEEPFFQEGPVGIAVSEVAEEGIPYFSAAGNDNLIDSAGNDIASWETPTFRNPGTCPKAVVELSEEVEEREAKEGEVPQGLHPTHCLDFDPAVGVDRTFGITVEAAETLLADLQWAEPWNGVGTDLDVFLLNAAGELVTAAGEDNVGGSQLPLEVLPWENETGADANVQLVVNRFSGGSPRLKLVLLENGRGVTATEYPESSEGDVVGPTIFGHSGGEDAVSVGAVPYFSKAAPEPYSSRGAVTHYFEPADGTTAAKPLGSAKTLQKPDLVATDGGANTFFGSCVSHVWRFYGTSAAAPHAAAVAALELEAKPTATVAEVVEAQTAEAQAVGSPPFPATAVGDGLLDAVGAVRHVLGLPEEDVEFVPPPEAVPPDCVAANPPAPPLPPPTPPTGPGGEASAIRKQPPRTFLRRHPRKVIHTDSAKVRVVFRFGSDEAGATFFCRVDGAPIRICPERFVRRFAAGSHVLRAMARDAEGRVDPTPVVFRFRVEGRG
jgi:hypothetical protein